MLLHRIRITTLIVLAVVLLNLLPGGVSARSSSLPVVRPLATAPYTGFTPPPAWACTRTFTYQRTAQSSDPGYGLRTYLQANGWGTFSHLYAYLPSGWIEQDFMAQDAALYNLLATQTLGVGDMVHVRYLNSYTDQIGSPTITKLKVALNNGATLVVDTDSVASTGDLNVNALFQQLGVTTRRDQSRSFVTSARFASGYNSSYPKLNRVGAPLPGQAVAVIPGNLLGVGSTALYRTDEGFAVMSEEPVGVGLSRVLADTQAMTGQTYVTVAVSHPDHLQLQATHNACTRHTEEM